MENNDKNISLAVHCGSIIKIQYNCSLAVESAVCYSMLFLLIKSLISKYNSSENYTKMHKM